MFYNIKKREAISRLSLIVLFTHEIGNDSSCYRNHIDKC